MPLIGVTGGVATGKSTSARKLATILSLNHQAELFSADECARRLCEENHEVLSQIRQSFGEGVFSTSGKLDRGRLRDLVFDNPSHRRELESILHPLIRAEWMTRAERFRVRDKYFIAEIPLLYETQADVAFDHVMVIASSRQKQMERLTHLRGWTWETACRVVETQMPLADKIRRAQTVIWNDHTEILIDRQITAATESLKNCYA